MSQCPSGDGSVMEGRLIAGADGNPRGRKKSPGRAGAFGAVPRAWRGPFTSASHQERHSDGRYLAARVPPVQVQVICEAGGVPETRAAVPDFGSRMTVLSLSILVP